MNSFAALLMVKIHQAASSGGFPERMRESFLEDNGESIRCLQGKMLDVLALRGQVFPNSFRYFDLVWYWTPYMSPEFDTRRYVESCQRYADDFARRIQELSSLFDVELTEEEMYDEREKYLVLSLFGAVIPQLKYSANLVFTKFWRELPPDGSPRTHFGMDLFPRRLRVAIQCLSNDSNRRRTVPQVLINTVFMGFKKGLLPVDPWLVQIALDKHRTCLTQTRSNLDDDQLDDIQEKAAQILSKWRPDCVNGSWEDTDNQSSHSTYQVPYGKGGSIGYCRDHLYGAKSPYVDSEGRYTSGISCMLSPEIIGFAFDKTPYSGSQRWPKEEAHYDFLRKKPMFRWGYSVTPVYQIGYVHTQDILSLFPDSVIRNREISDDHFKTCLEAVPACILEPMKVRMITKPSVGLHTRMHKLQVSLWNFLYRKGGAFELIGEPLRKDHLYRFFERWDVYSKMVSGDYTAATDNLNPDVTRSIVKAMGDKIIKYDTRLYENLQNSLTKMDILQEDTMLPNFKDFPHLEHFKFITKNFRQTWGQLMGHVVSFVILCVANAIAYWTSIEEFLGKPISWTEVVKEYPVLINGDDILFRSPCDRFYSIWMHRIRDFGFEPSVGKNFCNDRFLQVNSELYRIDTYLEKDESSRNYLKPCLKDLIHVPYVNFGLITNRAKNDCSKDLTVQRVGVAGHKGIVSEDSLLGRLKVAPTIVNKLVRGLPETVKEGAMKLYWNHNEEMLRHFGVWKHRHLFGNENYEFLHSSIVKSDVHKDLGLLRLFNDQSLKTEHGELNFEYNSVRQLDSALRNPFSLTDFVGLGFCNADVQAEWIRC